MSKSEPLVTVYIPTYNRVELLKRAIESVRNQTYSNLEIIIVDDCSTDTTRAYLAEISAIDTRIKYILKEENSGACASRNIAIDMAQGEYITGLDDDDIFCLDRVQAFIDAAMNYDMKKTMLFSSYRYSVNTKLSWKNKIRLFFSKKNVTQSDLLWANYIGNQIFIETSNLRKVGGFDTEFRMWQDFDCWYRLLESNKAILVKNMSYVVDTDHGYTRITDPSKLDETYGQFCQKHNLSNFEKDLLTLHTFHYGNLNVSLKNFVLRCCKFNDIRDFIDMKNFFTRKLKW